MSTDGPEEFKMKTRSVTSLAVSKWKTQEMTGILPSKAYRLQLTELTTGRASDLWNEKRAGSQARRTTEFEAMKG